MKVSNPKSRKSASHFLNRARKKMRSVVRKNFARLPDHVRAYLERRLFQIHLDSLPKEIIFKLAETKDELEQSFQLLHDSYVREGYMRPNKSGLRVTPYHAIPTTTTLVAKLGDEVVGTVSLIRQSNLKLPIQTAFDIFQVMGVSDQAVEISSLAINPKHRGQEAQLLFWLAKYVLEYCRKYFAIDYIFITVNPKHKDLYENIILFQPLQSAIVKQYDFANGAPAVAEYIDLREYSNRLLSVYWNQPPEKNVYAFIMVHQLPRQFKFPERAVFTVSDPVMTPELLDYFFNKRTSAFKDMNEVQLETLHQVYSGFPEYEKVLPPSKRSHRREEYFRPNRYLVQCPTTFCINDENQIHECEIIQVSETGFLARFENPIKIGDRLKAQVRINDFEVVEVEAVAVSARAGVVGFSLKESASGWAKLIGHLTSDRNKIKTSTKPIRGVS